jgi:hypothetical protein
MAVNTPSMPRRYLVMVMLYGGAAVLAFLLAFRFLKVAACLIILVLPTPFGPPQGGVPPADIL